MNYNYVLFFVGVTESRKKLQKHHHVHKPKPAAIIKNLKPQNALKASKTIVLAKKNKLQGSLRKPKYIQNLQSENSPNTEQEPTEVQRESDDSIGSASDLRDVDEISDGDPVSESEIESLDVPSVYTCGSSVYHAECESMTASNTFETRRRKRVVRETTIKSEEEEDQISQQGDKPLLDEFDSDASPQFWDSAWNNDTKDVFAMAPFQKPDGEMKKKKSKQEDLVTFSPEKLRLDLLTFSESDSQHDESVIRRKYKSPNLIILSESDSDLKKPQELGETQTLLTNKTQAASPHLIKDVTVTERLHLVREKLKPLEKLEDHRPFNNCNVEIVENPVYYQNQKSNLFLEREPEKFQTTTHGFTTNVFQEENVPDYSEKRDIFGYTPFYVLPSNKNPFEGDDFKPTVNDKIEGQYFKENDGQHFMGSYQRSTNEKTSSPVFDNKTAMPNNYNEKAFIKNPTEKESKVHFSLSDKILNFKSEKKIYYDSLKHEEKAKKKMEEKNLKMKNSEKTGEKSKKHKNDRKVERGFSNMSFEDCLSGEENQVEESCTIEARVKQPKPLYRRSNPFT